MTDDFSNAPPSITELRSNKTLDATDWTPRDVLVSMLRDIDAGVLSLDKIIVVFNKTGDDVTPVHIHNAKYTRLQAVAALEIAKMTIFRED